MRLQTHQVFQKNDIESLNAKYNLICLEQDLKAKKLLLENKKLKN